MNLALDWLRTRRGEDPMAFLDDVFRYAYSRLGGREDAEDIAIEVVQSLPNPCFRRNLRLYMIGMARRKVALRLRRGRPSVVLREAEAAVRFDGLSDETALVGAVLAALSPDHREVLKLKYMAGLSSAEIGAFTGRKPEAVDSLLQRARACFAAEWERHSSDEVSQ